MTTERDELLILAQLRGIAEHLKKAYPLLQADADLIDNAAALIREQAAELDKESEAHAQLQARCYDQGGTFSNVFDELKSERKRAEAAQARIAELERSLVEQVDGFQRAKTLSIEVVSQLAKDIDAANNRCSSIEQATIERCAKDICPHCATGRIPLEYQADPEPCYWHGNTHCHASKIRLRALAHPSQGNDNEKA